MESKSKSTSLKEGIFKETILAFYETMVNDLLTRCESEIERQLLLSIMKYIFNDIYYSGPEPLARNFIGTKDNFNEWRINSVACIWETKDEWFSLDKKELENYKSQGYKVYGPDLAKVIGIKFTDRHEYESFYTIYELLPQFELKATNLYRLDFALLSSYYENGTLIKESKVSIECDGYEFHSTPHKLTKDKKRDRLLQKDDWKICRMSGSEIFGIKTYKDIENIINELRTFTK